MASRLSFHCGRFKQRDPQAQAPAAARASKRTPSVFLAAVLSWLSQCTYTTDAQAAQAMFSASISMAIILLCGAMAISDDGLWHHQAGQCYADGLDSRQLEGRRRDGTLNCLGMCGENLFGLSGAG